MNAPSPLDYLPEVRRLRGLGWGSRRIGTKLGIGKDSALRCLNKLKLEDARAAVPVPRRAILATRSDWASEITASWRRSVEDIIETGRVISRAKEALPHGEFLAMVESDLPFKRRMAQMLMEIAADPRTTNAQFLARLPPSLSVIHQILKLPPEIAQAHITDGTIHPEMQGKDIARSATASKRQVRIAQMAELSANPLALPEGPFGAGIADPPWENPAAPIGHTDRHYREHYPTMTPEAIAALPVAPIFGPISFLALWITRHHLAIGSHLPVLAAWGFVPVTVVTWDKESTGLGNGYVRDRNEHIVFAVRGKPPVPPPELRPDSLFAHRRSRIHSEKPDWMHERIEEWFSGVSKVELFCRGPARPGWVAWGNQALALHDSETGELTDADAELTAAQSPCPIAANDQHPSPPASIWQDLHLPPFLAVKDSRCFRNKGRDTEQ